MSPWTISASTVISLLATALAGIAVFFVKRYSDKLEQLDAEAVRKRELKELEERLSENQHELEDRLTQSQREMHTQNSGMLSEIRADIGRMTARIDAMFHRGSPK